MIVFDIESNGLLDTISRLHCINAIDRATGREYRYTDHEFYQNVDGSLSDVRCPRSGTLADGFNLLQGAQVIAGHNIIAYDAPAIRKVYPDVVLRARMYDSKVASQLIYPDLKDRDFARLRKGKLPESFRQYVGSHSLFPWGIRLGGEAKSDFTPAQYGHTWATMPFTQEMDEYCMQDVRANVALIEHFESRQYSEQALWLEMDVHHIITWQERSPLTPPTAWRNRASRAPAVRPAVRTAGTVQGRVPPVRGQARQALCPKTGQRPPRLQEGGAGAEVEDGGVQPVEPPARGPLPDRQVRVGADRVHRHRPAEDRRERPVLVALRRGEADR